MDDIRQRLETIERTNLLRLLSQLIHELTIHARCYYEGPDAIGTMRETNEAIHRISGHLRDLIDVAEPFTSSRADSIGDYLKLFTPAALDRLFGCTTYKQRERRL